MRKSMILKILNLETIEDLLFALKVTLLSLQLVIMNIIILVFKNGLKEINHALIVEKYYLVTIYF